MSGEAWHTLTAELAEAIPQLADGDTIILRGDGYFAQMQQGPSWLTVEAVSNEFLYPERQLGREQHERLARIGWSLPQPPGRLNWWRTFPWPLRTTDAIRVASMLTSTLQDVYGIQRPQGITKEQFNAFV